MVCPNCRKMVVWSAEKKCETCGGDTVTVPRNWSPPKRRDTRAWKRIAKGEVLWDRRRVYRKRRNRNDTFVRFGYNKVVIPCEPDCDDLLHRHFGHNGYARYERIPGSRYEKTNYNRTPDIDMGG